MSKVSKSDKSGFEDDGFRPVGFTEYEDKVAYFVTGKSLSGKSYLRTGS